MKQDAVDRIIEQWHRELPDLELDPMALFGRIHRISQKVSARNHAAFAEFGIGRNEFDVLASIRRSGEPFTLSPKQIGASLMLSSGGLTGRLDKLESAGFVERLPDPSDRRGLKIRLTEAGREAVEGAVRAELVILEEALAGLDAKERKQLGGLLRKLHGAFEDQPFG
ncbi:MarR family transcriptional regulator [Glycomyces sp. TRM65418]|uniref:MarR family winged helix-turn-helix transcriptional regulator n=1 Tax=Glycomyces sp. TRM65418 TaxID=2867006 RepID=UPI001CE65EFE|nr:MarR family transcriptional regulator [Glycomyces sp. TRM65418]MCC3762133.1 MarR family transcriptional regulator [Glycomyces sp. TRM65418]QZD56197.1 MarR family transcriptional regulator [Glycomyces sp. TRM65418]